MVILHEIARQATDADVSTAEKAVMAAIADAHHLVPKDVVIVPLGAVPKTTSGKVRRSAAREAYADQRFAPLSVQPLFRLKLQEPARAR